ncbi:SAV_915 family protein [Amycolatopsis antarctica]|nr:SAV_915 family protein [Amycolatopsis antarctica]
MGDPSSGPAARRTGELRAFNRAAMLSLDELTEHPNEGLYVLTVPEGPLELYQTARNEIVLWAYSHMAGLVASCGEGQPYVRATADDIIEFGETLDSAVLVALDAWHPDGVRYPAPDPSEIEPMEHLELTGDDMATTGLLWIATRPVQEGDRQVDAELYCRKPGQPLLLAYSSLPALVAACGPHQAAAAIEAHRLDEVAVQSGASGIVLDVPFTEDAQHSAPVRDWSRRNI